MLNLDAALSEPIPTICWTSQAAVRIYAIGLASVRVSPAVEDALTEFTYVHCLQTLLHIILGALHHPGCFFCGVREEFSFRKRILNFSSSICIFHLMTVTYGMVTLENTSVNLYLQRLNAITWLFTMFKTNQLASCMY